MTPPLFLSRAMLRRDAAIEAIAPVLLPDEDDLRIAAGHRLVWSLFAGDPARKRDFLYHEEKPGTFLILSPDAPDHSNILDVETKPFTSLPAAGDRLSFFLRVNPTMSISQPGVDARDRRQRSLRVDIVMHRLKQVIPQGRTVTGQPLIKGEGRAHRREALLGWSQEEGDALADRPVHDWMARQGESGGFSLEGLTVLAYRRVTLPRAERGQPAVLGIADIEGSLLVTDAAAFEARLRSGFGRAKAFGCGLMLLKRV